MNRIVEVIHPNIGRRTYGVTKLFELPKDGFMLRPTSPDIPESIKPLMDAFWSLPSVKGIGLHRAEISIEVTEAWDDFDAWTELSPLYLDVIKEHLFPGEEVQTSIRDDRVRYARSSRDDD